MIASLDTGAAETLQYFTSQLNVTPKDIVLGVDILGYMHRQFAAGFDILFEGKI
jgi:hypothetical protein